MQPPLTAFFHPASDGGQRLYLHHTPPASQPLRGAVLYVHPWGEEMNKSRRMTALASRALAANGWAVLQADLLGCGDSSGDFGDASWDAWVDDVARAAQWLLARHAGAPLWLWGLRAGALLATAASPRLVGPVNFLFWQPAQQGKALLQQFLRLKAAGDMIGGSAGKGATDALRQTLAGGKAVEVAGYSLAPALADGMAQATLQPPAQLGRVEWLEVSNLDGTVLSPAVCKCIERWRDAGHTVRGQVLVGPAFWQTTEIELAPALLAATIAALAPAEATPSVVLAL